jgi:hypothetical protein
MRRLSVPLALAAAAALAVLPAAADAPAGGFLDPAGWEGLQEYWKVSGDSVVGTTPSPDGLKFNTFLCSKKKYRDFELSFEVRLKDGKGNSGVQIRSEIFDMPKFAVKGPQCDIGAQYWGSLYGEHFGGMMKAAPPEVVKKAVEPASFNLYAIKVVGKHVTITVNGERTVDGDFEKLPDEGIIAWQLHAGPPMEVTFRKVTFRDLSK